jgi:hypothetical protein
MGGGCGKLVIENKGTEDCANLEVKLNINPDFGGIAERDGKQLIIGLTLIDSDAEAGVLCSCAWQVHVAAQGTPPYEGPSAHTIDLPEPSTPVKTSYQQIQSFSKTTA